MARSKPKPSTSILFGEQGTIRKEAGCPMAIGYPAPYRVGASSLGFQWVYKALNQIPNLSCGRFFMPTRGFPSSPLVTAEMGRDVGSMRAIAFSIACEQELMNIVALLKAAGIAPLSKDRHDDDPPVIIGGPLTSIDPRLVSPLADLVAVGEADTIIRPLGMALVATNEKEDLYDVLEADRVPIWIPSRQNTPVRPLPAPPACPASAATWSPNAELKDLFLVEATRGCRRGCTFCVMSRKADFVPQFHPFSVEQILSAIPRETTGVGLVGAAVTDHPQIETIVSNLVEQGKRVSLSSIRADRLTENLAKALKNSGLKTLTIAADGASERIRRSLRKGISAKQLLTAVQIATKVGLNGVKVYSMVGLPGETDEDVIEYADLLLTLADHTRKLSTTVQAFVPKPGTPIQLEPMADIATCSHRLDLIKQHVKGRVKVLPSSPKWSWIDWKLAHAGEKAVQAAILAYQNGGNFSAWKKAIKTLEP